MSRVPASERTRKQIAEVSSGDFDQSALPGAKHLLDWRDRELLAPISPFGTFLVTLKEDIARQAPDPTPVAATLSDRTDFLATQQTPRATKNGDLKVAV